MNDVLISNWNNTVSPEDTVYVVGDFFMGEKELWPEHRKKLNGKIVLIMGNHDVYSKSYTKNQNKSYMLSCGIEEVYNELYYNHNGTIYWMNHYPPKGICSFTDARPEQTRPTSYQKYDVLLFGHIHSNINVYGVNGAGKPLFHVGTDANNFTPLDLNVLNELVKQIK
jgi:calcineurin-like phosphoesterase family protein